jgi:hypothetical protein
VKQQSRAIQARWAAEHATEDALRSHFQTIPLDRALALLGQMRHNCELAGQILNGRINVPEIQRCKTCGLTYDDMRKAGKPDWFLNRPHYSAKDRSIIEVDHFCSGACVSMENNKTQGVHGMPDRGMLRTDNPANHKIDLERAKAKV